MLQESNAGSNHQLQALQSKHSKLETELQKEQERPNPNELAVSRLKREKLAVKDEIARLAVS